jgi:hypothetical protein
VRFVLCFLPQQQVAGLVGETPKVGTGAVFSAKKKERRKGKVESERRNRIVSTLLPLLRSQPFFFHLHTETSDSFIIGVDRSTVEPGEEA